MGPLNELNDCVPRSKKPNADELPNTSRFVSALALTPSGPMLTLALAARMVRDVNLVDASTRSGGRRGPSRNPVSGL